ncbi:hypothetical protein YPPY53_3755, partial [Yersinia pestis PY-53]
MTNGPTVTSKAPS